MAAPPLPSLDKLDPARAWEPWKPDATQPWDRKWAAHLYGRAAFGATPVELRQAVADGLPATLDLLLKGAPRADDNTATLMKVGDAIARRNINELRGWWVYCMLHGGHPLREKLTLFWHNHFATSNAKVNSPKLMLRQNKLLREHALGKFEPFLQAMSKDVAMLKWLDSDSNVKGHPNENYARELMELFTLGVGNYTEKDIREAARAFTGWHTNGEDGFFFDKAQHDDGPKTVLGQTGNWKGDDVVRILLKRPAAATFLVGKLYASFVSEAQLPPPKLLEPLCARFRKSNYDIADLVRTMLSSRLFFSHYAYRQRVKGPAEYVLGAVRATTEGTIKQQLLVPHLDRMGQSLFAPPNVKGWRGGRAWLSTATLLARQNFAQDLAMGTLWSGGSFRGTAVVVEVKETPGAPPAKRPDAPEEPAPPRGLDPARHVADAKAAKPEDVARVLLDVYLPGGVADDARAKIVAFLADGKPADAALSRRAREAVHALLTMPDYQLA